MKFKVLLVIILLIAAALRFYKITEIPALNADEAALGYNAYSLLETGKDEHGDSWPLVFKSFGDYKPGVYVYLAMPFVKWLGLNVMAVRLPGVILSVISVWLVYLVTKELFSMSFLRRQEFMEGGKGKSDVKNQTSESSRTMGPRLRGDDEALQARQNYEWLALLAALMLAISPWHIHFSRGAWETQVAITFLFFGVYAFLRGLQNQKWLGGFVLSFVLAIYTYHSMRVVVPLLGASLLLIYRDNFRKDFSKLKFLITLAIPGVILLFPLLWSLFGSTGLSRAQGVSIFADLGPIARIDETRGIHFGKAPLVMVRVLHNKVSGYGIRFLENYSKHFAGGFLFLEGDDIQRNKVPEFGQLLLVGSPFLLIGIWCLAGWFWSENNERRKVAWVILTWLVIAPIPAALTFQSPHAVRALSMMVPISVVLSLGIIEVSSWTGGIKWIGGHWPLIIGHLVIAGLFVWDTSRYLHNYYKLMVPWFPFSSQYGFEELVPWAEGVKGNYDQVFITDRYDQPYILFLFYSKYRPEDFQRQVILTPRDKFGFSTVRKYDNYHFDVINFPELVELYPNSLVVGTDEEIPEDAKVIKELKLPDGKVTFQMAEI